MKNLRDIAAEWHAGQFSELYKFSISGRCDDLALLHQEVNDCFQELAKFPEDERDGLALDLTQLRRALIEIFGDPDIIAEDNSHA
mgnify:CR=1 FL=1